MTKRFVPYAERADKWIQENKHRIIRKAPISIYDAENILVSELGYGLLNREDVQTIFFDENEENLVGLRMLFKCLGANRRFISIEKSYPDSNGKYFRITEIEDNILRTYNVPAIKGMREIIDGYLTMKIALDIDFDTFEMSTMVPFEEYD